MEVVNNSNFNGTFTTSYTEDGFTVTAVTGGFGLERAGTLASIYPGSTALLRDDFGANTRLTKVGGGAFDLLSIELTGTSTDIVTATFTGTKSNNTTVTQLFTTDNVQNTLQAFKFSNFNDLVKVEWINTGGSIQFDNINVSAASATDVPEPFTVLGTLFGAGYGVALKRKLAKAQADKEDIS